MGNTWKGLWGGSTPKLKPSNPQSSQKKTLGEPQISILIPLG